MMGVRPRVLGGRSLGGSPGGALEIPGMLDGFPDLVAWRDGIYRDFFPQK